MAKMMETQLCPGCGATLNAATGVTTGEPPKQGDLSVCIYCGQMLEWKDTSFIKLSDEVFSELPRGAQALLGEIVRFAKEQNRRHPLDDAPKSVN